MWDFLIFQVLFTISAKLSQTMIAYFVQIEISTSYRHLQYECFPLNSFAVDQKFKIHYLPLKFVRIIFSRETTITQLHISCDIFSLHLCRDNHFSLGALRQVPCTR
jgi:hypothetical protein